MGFPLPPRSPGATCDPGGGSPAIGRATTGPTAALEKQSHAHRGLVEVRDLNGPEWCMVMKISWDSNGMSMTYLIVF